MSRDPTQAKWIQAEVLAGTTAPQPGHPNNPDAHTLGSDTELAANGPMRGVYVVDLDATGSARNLQGFTDQDGNTPPVGTILVLTTGNGAPSKTITVDVSASGGATAGFNGSGGTDDTYNAANETGLYIWDGALWEHFASSQGSSL